MLSRMDYRHKMPGILKCAWYKRRLVERYKESAPPSLKQEDFLSVRDKLLVTQVNAQGVFELGVCETKLLK